MSTANRTRASIALWIVFAVGLLAGRALAQPSFTTSGSIVIGPKIIWDGTRDTVVEVANTSNGQVHALCLYLDGATGLQVNFEVVVTLQNSARWQVSEGRLCPGGTGCDSPIASLIPPVPLGFRGSLICVETDSSGSALSGNHLTAGFTVLDLLTGDAASYEGASLVGIETNDGDDTLCLGPDLTSACPFGPEYNGCPTEWILSHAAEGAADPVAGEGSTVGTTLTFVNCGQDFFAASVAPVPLEFEITNEMEERFSATTTVASWAEASLEQINEVFGLATLGTTYAQTRIVSLSGGVAIIANETRTSGGVTPATGTAAFHLAHTGTVENDHSIVLPPHGNGF